MLIKFSAKYYKNKDLARQIDGWSTKTAVFKIDFKSEREF